MLLKIAWNLPCVFGWCAYVDGSHLSLLFPLSAPAVCHCWLVFCFLLSCAEENHEVTGFLRAGRTSALAVPQNNQGTPAVSLWARQLWAVAWTPMCCSAGCLPVWYYLFVVAFFLITKCKHFLWKMNIFVFCTVEVRYIRDKFVAKWESCGHHKPAWNLPVVKQEKQEQTVRNEIVLYGNTWCFCNTISFLL